MPRSKQTKQEKPKAAAKKSSKKEEKVEVVKPVEVVVEKVVAPVEVDEVMLISKDFTNFLSGSVYLLLFTGDEMIQTVGSNKLKA